jgi:hypothetical protein
LWPTSADDSRYELPFAPIATHAPPALSQRSHRNENEIGCFPVHDPGFAVTTEPFVIVPLTVGVDVFTGTPTTTAVGFDATVFEPSAFAAVTRTRSLKPTSARTSRYRRSVAREMIAQLPPSGCPPSAPHRTHWYANEIGCVPVHVPFVVLSVAPCSARPLMAGSAVFDGAVA